MNLAYVNGVVLPAEIIAGLITIAAAILMGGALIVRSVSRSFANHLDLADKKRQSEFQKENEKWQVELENLKRESITTAAAYQFVLNAANKLSDRVDLQDKTIADLQAGKESALRQLEESRKSSKTRDEQIGALQATLTQTTTERDQEREQRKVVEQQRNDALAQVAMMEKKIADLEAKAADLPKLLLRVEELERRQQERHEAANKLQERLNEIELRAMTAEHERDQAKSELEAERRKSQSIPTPVANAAEQSVIDQTGGAA